MTEDRRQTLGRRGEDAAAAHLIRRGFEIVERNYRTRWGELDIVAYDGEALAFCEVKARQGTGVAVSPLESVRGGKQAQVRRMAAQWLRDRSDRPRARLLRFDAIGVTFDASGRLTGIDHLEGAF